MKKRSGIYLPGDKNPREWITCKACGEKALVRVGGQGFCSRNCANHHRTGAAHPKWRGTEASYAKKHERVYRSRGKASRCERCGRSDADAIYDWANLTGNYDDVQDYAPMCRSCHAAYDAPSQPRGEAVSSARLTEVQVRAVRVRHAAGETAYSMSSEYGVSAVALMNAIRRKTWRHVA